MVGWFGHPEVEPVETPDFYWIDFETCTTASHAQP
jgi:hypothetical protein